VLLTGIRLVGEAPAQAGATHQRHDQGGAQGRQAEGQNRGEIRPAGNHHERCTVGMGAGGWSAGESLSRAAGSGTQAG